MLLLLSNDKAYNLYGASDEIWLCYPMANFDGCCSLQTKPIIAAGITKNKDRDRSRPHEHDPKSTGDEADRRWRRWKAEEL